jgi:hypothetical protein
MSLPAQRVSKMNDNRTWCLPSKGYDHSIEVEFDQYEEVTNISVDLPENDLDFPKGAPMAGYIKIGDKIFKKKTP